MLRLPPYRFHRPMTVVDAVELLAEHGDRALPIAGGTDLIPNMKHRLFEPEHLVALGGIEELKGVRREDGFLSMGAAATLSSLAASEAVIREAPALAQAAGQVAGPQLRNAGTLGGNVCLDTRCTYYNQSLFWRRALGYCLKKDGDVCHVTRVGRKCVASHSADTPPVLMVMDAVVDLVGPEGSRSIPIADFFVADGIWNTRRTPGEIVTRVRVPLPPARARSAYVKLRQRRSIDFPLLTVAVSARLEEGGSVESIQGVVTALGARPKVLTGWSELALGEPLSEDLIEALAERAHRQCQPLESIIVDPEWRKAMVPVYVGRALRALLPAA